MANIPQPNQHQQPPQTYTSNATSANKDLIDFGNDSAGSTIPHSQPMNNQVTESRYVPHGLQEPLQPQMGEPITRQDTITSEVDEFVDAEDGR